MSSRQLRAKASLLAACLAAAAVSQGMAAVVDFSAANTTYQPADMIDFTVAGTGQNWTTPSVGVWQNHYSSGSNYGGNWNWGANLLDTTGLATSDFRMSTHLAVTSFSGSPAWDLGYSVLGSASQTGGSNTPDSWYGAVLRLQGTSASLDIIKQTAWSGVSSLGGNQAVSFFANGNTYDFTFTGTRSAGTLTLALTLTDLTNSANTLTVSTAQMSGPYSGAKFGFHDLLPGTGGGVSGTVQYSNFSLANAIPEPASMGLLALGGLVLMRRRKA